MRYRSVVNQLLGKSPLGQGLTIALVVGAGLLIALLVWFVVVRPQQLAREAAMSRADSAFSQGTAESAKEAIKLGEEATREKASIDQQVKEGVDAIRSNPESQVPLTRGSNCTALRANCVSKSYRDTAFCREVLRTCS